MQTDWGGEYEKLHAFFQTAGITHHVSCPHAHQQNGSAERKHRHIVEVGLTLLANASMPLKYWDEAFLTATFLINLLPSKVINLESPAERLLHITPNYDALRTFGCACWPNLRPYNTRKLAFRSKRCVFLGYSPLHKGVKCLDVSTGRVYISRDVVFDENVFPFHGLHPNAGALLKQQILLLPTNNLSESVSNIDDHMPTIVPVTTSLFDDPQENMNTGENSTSNGASTLLQPPSEENADRTHFEKDSGEHSPASPDSHASDPEEDPIFSDSAPGDSATAGPRTSFPRVGTPPPQPEEATSSPPPASSPTASTTPPTATR
jgi:histone deacetylase 1/2